MVCACVSQQPQSVGQCIKPTFNVAFPTYATAIPGSYPTKVVLPGGNWHIETTVPINKPESIGSSIVQRDNEIWTIISGNEGEFVLRYRIDTHQWTRYATINGKSILPQILVVTKNSSLWGVGLDYTKSGEVNNKIYPILSRFDDASDQFEFVNDSDGSLETFNSLRIPPMVVADNTGTLWMILNKGGNTPSGLYSYNPEIGKMVRHLQNIKLSGYGSLAVAPDGDVWILDSDLIQYHPTTGKYEDGFKSKQEWDIQNWNGDLYFDRLGKLWSGTDGWFDFSDPNTPVWYKIIPSPEFISNYTDGDDQFSWSRSSFDFQSSNGWYWFSSPGIGIVQLNAETGEWCRFTTEFSPVIEDSHQNIRIIISGKIYLYNTNQ